MEKYANYLKDEGYKDAFKDFYHYNNEFDAGDKNNTTEKKFYNPHINIQTNNSKNNLSSNTNLANGYTYQQDISNPATNRIIQDKLSNIDTKFSKIKMMSSSGSTNSLLRHYRQSSSVNGNTGVSSNSTSSTNSNNYNNQLGRRSGSSANLNY